MQNPQVKQSHDNLFTTLGAFVCTIAALFYCYEYLLRIIPGVMETELRVAFGNISATGFGTLSAYYYFAYTPLQLPAGVMMDRFGPRRLLIAACLFCAVGQWMFAQTDSFTTAAVGRFAVGLGSAFAFVGVLALADLWLPKAFFSLVAGLVTMLGMIGAIVGQVGMSYLVGVIGWHSVLHLAVWLGVGLSVLLWMVVSDSPHGHKPVAKQLSWRSFLRGMLIVFRDPQMWLIGLIGSILFLSLSVFGEIWGKSYLMTAHHLSDMRASESVSLVFLGWAVGGPIQGWISDNLPRRVPTLKWNALVAAIPLSVIVFIADIPLWALNVLLFLYGFFSSVQVTVFAIAKENSHLKLTGTVLATVNMIIMLGGVFFQPLVGKCLDMVWAGTMVNNLRIYNAQEYQEVFSFLPVSLILVFLLCYLVREHAHGRHPVKPRMSKQQPA